MNNRAPQISLRNISKKYGNHIILDHVSLDIYTGDFVSIFGKSGGGDSDIMMTDTINPLKSKFKGFHKTFKQDD